MNYLNSSRWNLDRVSLDYHGVRFRGPGFLDWKPEEGFQLEGFLEALGELPKTIGVGKPFPDPGEGSSVRLILEHSGGFGYIPILPLSNLFSLHSGRLSLHPTRLLFLHRSSPRIQKRWSGTALFRVGNLDFPDSVSLKTTLADRTLNHSNSRIGFLHNDPDHAWEIVGHKIDHQHFRLDWALSKTKHPKALAWRWPEIVGDALSIASGRRIVLLWREATRGRQRIVEFRRGGSPRSLPFWPLLHRGIPDKDSIIDLVRLFAADAVKWRICRRILHQLSAASDQDSWQASELLVATILEAILRTLEGKPSTDRSWDISQSLSRFRTQYLSPDFKTACRLVLQSFNELRHRNAHPDWLTGEGGLLSQDGMRASFDDMTRLAWFYGQMMLGMAGSSKLDPRHPKSHRHWPPMIRVSFGDD